MEFIALAAKENDCGRRLDRIARRVFVSQPLSKIYEYIRKGFIRVNRARVEPHTLVAQGDLIECAAFLFENDKNARASLAPSTPRAAANPAGADVLPVLFKNECVLVINKPRGITAHSSTKAPALWHNGAPSVSEWLLAHHGGAESLSFVPSPLHRLDKNTTGILVCSQNRLGAQWFSGALKNRLVQKTYLTLVEGIVNGAQTWEDFLCRENAAPQSAVTRVKPLAWGTLGAKTVTLLELILETGRKHQIRKQSALRGFPLLGDTRYGGSIWKTDSAPSAHTYFLHARSIRFPLNNPPRFPPVITAPLPQDFSRLASLLGWTEGAHTISMASPYEKNL
jgi:23S rRNA pseudouridine955/2504/2580 synthase